VLGLANYRRLGIEFELGVRLGIDISASNRGILCDAPLTAIDGVCPAMEMVDDRCANYQTLDVLSLIADNSWNAGVVLGEFRQPECSLSAIEGVVSCDGMEIDRGLGREVLGHPLAPLAWLADHLLARGRQLRKGDLVITGSIVKTRFPMAGQQLRFDISGLGHVTVEIRA
jgi:2-oxo-3-hexenedioate decarboxylase/2-keto-4-pentenoate hydratase